VKILDDAKKGETDSMMRLYSAVALAQWNVRSGVAALIESIEEACIDATSKDPAVCKEAGNELVWFNTHKGWGLPLDDMRRSVEGQGGLNQQDMGALYVSAIKTWFAENEHRFPDWKPGDPLPEVEASQEEPADGNGK